MKYNLNFDWLFVKANTPFPLSEAEKSISQGSYSFFDKHFDTIGWENVSIPHCPNSSDSFDNLIRDAGEASLYRGFMFYRKSFTLHDIKSKKFFLEFEAVRQSIYLYVNSSFAGYYEAGTAPVGFDITAFVTEGENLIALATDNCAYRECEFTTIETIPGNPPGDLSGERYQWNQKDFNEVQGGITGNVNLYITPLLYQTLPLYNNLKTTGTYIYPSDFDFKKNSAAINIQCEVRNETGTTMEAFIEISLLDGDKTIASAKSSAYAIPPAADCKKTFKTVVPSDAYSECPAPTNCNTCNIYRINTSFRVENLVFWSTNRPYLYDVKIRLVSRDMCDERIIRTGFRHVSYDMSKGGLLLNEKPVYLKGYAQRSTNEWAVIGVANDHLSDFDMQLVRKSGANYIRWMHVTPKPVFIRSGDKYGVVSVCPAGDKETDVQGRMWDMRMEAMRDAIIYFRNSPSVIFYEAGNNAISSEHMAEMTRMKNLLDPSGYRFMGCRSLTTPEQLKEAEWVGTMVYRYDSHAKRSMDEANYYIPMLETEYKRDESPRRVWDDFSPPDYDYDNKYLGVGAKKCDNYDVWDETQEEFCTFAASENDGYAYFYNNRIGGKTGNNYYIGAAIMVWSDSNMHGRNSGSENCRTSGKVDAVRIEKSAFYALKTMHSLKPAVHILGHWSYPADTSENYNYQEKVWNGTYFEKTGKFSRRDPKNKTVYVVASESVMCVELFINGLSIGKNTTPKDNYIYPFTNIDITQSGYIEAIAYDKNGNIAAKHRIETTGAPYKLTLTPYTGPQSLIADGSDICFFDVAVCDKEGRVCPLADNSITFSLEGDGIFLGGYNSGKYNDTSVIHKNYCFAECGVNRVFVRSTPFGKGFTLHAVSNNLLPASVSVTTKQPEIKDGFILQPQQAWEINTFTADEDYIFGTQTIKAASAKKDFYRIVLNGTDLNIETAYRPDSSTGVLCPLRNVLDALNVPYSYTCECKTVLTLTDSGAKIIEGETAIITNDTSNLTNAEFYVENGELTAEINAVLAYVENVEVTMNTSTKILEIKKLPEVQMSLT